jgi:RNA polymerase sigma-70 factor (ECF subfamily)
VQGHIQVSGLASSRQQNATEADRHADDRLIAAICARDLPAFEALYRDYYRRLSRFLLNLTHRPTIVEEVLNDTMMAVWQKPENYRGASRLSTWILAIAYNKAMRALQKQDVPVEYDEPTAIADPDAVPDRSAAAKRTQRMLQDAMARLSPDHRAVLDLTYFHGMGYREIAEVMECPIDTVKTRMFHARRNLKRLLAGAPADWL